MSQYKNIYYPSLLHESLRDYFSVNKSGKLSLLYRFLLCVLLPLQAAWDIFETYRQKIWLISVCKWQLGQMQNLLNYLYDPDFKRIFLTQSTVVNIYVPVFAENTDIYVAVFAETTYIYLSTANDLPMVHPMTINIPAVISSDALKYGDLIATVEKIRLVGLTYVVQTF
jgi:hypothetical protein